MLGTIHAKIIYKIVLYVPVVTNPNIQRDRIIIDYIMV